MMLKENSSNKPCPYVYLEINNDETSTHVGVIQIRNYPLIYLMFLTIIHWIYVDLQRMQFMSRLVRVIEHLSHTTCLHTQTRQGYY